MLSTFRRFRLRFSFIIITCIGASPPLTANSSSDESTSSVRYAKFFIIISFKSLRKFAIAHVYSLMMITAIGAAPPLTAINSSIESTSSVRFAKFFMIISLKDF